MHYVLCTILYCFTQRLDILRIAIVRFGNRSERIWSRFEVESMLDFKLVNCSQTLFLTHIAQFVEFMLFPVWPKRMTDRCSHLTTRAAVSLQVFDEL